jgi:hypothetical protein
MMVESGTIELEVGPSSSRTPLKKTIALGS